MHDALDTELCARIGCRYPIVQTGMGNVAVPELAAAASNAGACGFLAGATIPPSRLEASILRVKELTSAPFGVNFLMTQPNAAQVIDLVIAHRVPVVGYNRAPQPELVRRLKDAGVLCMPTIGAVKHARKAVAMGADILIVQGAEGGGHTGAVPTTILLPEVAATAGVPVVAAGGFSDGRGLAAALAYGAVGIAMGTRFLMSAESPVTAAAKDVYAATDEYGTVVTTVIDGLPQRVVRNRYLNRLEEATRVRRLAVGVRSTLRYRRESQATVRQLARSGWQMLRGDESSFTQLVSAANAPVLIRRALLDGDPHEGVMPTGQVVGRIGAVLTCEQIVEQIVAEARDALARLCPQQSGGD